VGFLPSNLTPDACRGARQRAKPRGRDRVLALVASPIRADAQTLEGIDKPLGALHEPGSSRLVILADLHHLCVVDQLAGQFVAGGQRPGMTETQDDRVEFVSEPTLDMQVPHRDLLDAHGAPEVSRLREMDEAVKHSRVPIFRGDDAEHTRRPA